LILADVNFLIYAFRTDSKDHVHHKTWLEDVINGPAAYGISPSRISRFEWQALSPLLAQRSSTAAARDCMWLDWSMQAARAAIEALFGSRGRQDCRGRDRTQAFCSGSRKRAALYRSNRLRVFRCDRPGVRVAGRSYRQRDPLMPYIQGEGFVRSLQRDPRYKSLLAEDEAIGVEMGGWQCVSFFCSSGSFGN
jgi:hypothetical protein